MGEAYGGIIGIIVMPAAVFTSGMELIGLTKALIDVMKGSEQIAGVSRRRRPPGDCCSLRFW